MSIPYMALGFEPSEHESPPITTRQWQPPLYGIFVNIIFNHWPFTTQKSTINNTENGESAVTSN